MLGMVRAGICFHLVIRPLASASACRASPLTLLPLGLNGRTQVDRGGPAADHSLARAPLR